MEFRPLELAWKAAILAFRYYSSEIKSRPTPPENVILKKDLNYVPF